MRRKLLNFMRRARPIMAWVSLACGLVFVLVVFKNTPPGWPRQWNAAQVERERPAGARATGRTGVVVVALLQPSHFEPRFTLQFIEKLLDVVIPWPINRIAGRDTATALIDPTLPDATVKFAPRALMDWRGRAAGDDGVPYLRRWQQGAVAWLPPSSSVAGDIGSFQLKGTPGGAPDPSQRAMLKAKYLYYPRLPGGYLPQRDQTLAMVNSALAIVGRNPAVVGATVYDIYDRDAARAALEALLDKRLDTLVLASTFPIHSGFEEYHAAYPKLKDEIAAWAKRTGRPEPKLLLVPGMANSSGYRAFLAAHLARVAPRPIPGARATVIVSLHGLPAMTRKNDAWGGNADRATPPLLAALVAALRAKGWGDVRGVVAQEAFANGVEDPGNAALSTGEAMRAAAARGDALAIAIPAEFLSENSDTLFLHSYLMFDGVAGYRRYQGPPANVNWSQPFVRRYRIGATDVIYTGTPGGAFQGDAGAMLAATITPLLPK